MRIGANLLFLLPNVVGGTETYAVSLLNAISMIDQDDEYWIYINRESEYLELPSISNFKREICSIQAKNRGFRYLWEQMVLPFKIKAQNLDLIHSFGYVQPLHPPCASVVTIHDLNFHNLASSMSYQKRSILRFFVTRSAQRADHIITVSEFSKKQIVEILDIPEDKVTVTYNAVRQKEYRPQPFEIVSEKYGLRQPYILALSSFSPHKNMASLIKAFAILRKREFRDLHLVVVGHSPNGKGSLEQLVQDLEIQDAVIFTGYVEDDVLPTLYAHAEAFVFPSLYEGFGIPVLEAFMYGAPVACSKAAALPEIAGDAACYFNPKNVEEMANVISQILCSGKLRKSLVDRGKEQVAKFTWEETARKTINVYKKVAGNG